MSGIIHKIESDMKHKIKEKLHLGHKEEGKKHDEGEEHKAEHKGHREQLKKFMHKVKCKAAGGEHGKKRRPTKVGKVHNEGEEEEDVEEEECEGEEEYGEEDCGGGFEFEF